MRSALTEFSQKMSSPEEEELAKRLEGNEKTLKVLVQREKVQVRG